MPWPSLNTYLKVIKTRFTDVAYDFIGRDVPETTGGAYARLSRQLKETPALVFPKDLKVNKAFFTSDVYLRQQKRADWQNVDPRMREFAGRMIAELRKNDMPFFVLWAFRTEHEQNEMVKKGTSFAKGIRAPHPQGKAVDIVHSITPYMLSEAQYALIGALGHRIANQMGIAVKWGGTFKRPYDPAHWELIDWRDDIRRLPVGQPLRITAAYLLQLHGVKS